MASLRPDLSEEIIAFIIRVKRSSEVVTYCPVEAGHKFLLNVVSYMSHTASHPRRKHSS
jgi:hypothetical protein